MLRRIRAESNRLTPASRRARPPPLGLGRSIRLLHRLRVGTAYPDGVTSKREEILERIGATDWGQWSSPSVDYLFDYRADSVAPAFEALAAVVDEESSRRAYNRLLYAIAHNHSGTPYSATVPGVRFLVELVPELDQWALAAAIDVLIELYGWVIGDTALKTADGQVHDLTVVHGVVVTLMPTLLALSESGEEPAARSAAELVDQIREIPPGGDVAQGRRRP